MSIEDINRSHYHELMEIFTRYNDAYNALYRLKTRNEEELNAIYTKIKQNLINYYNFPPDEIIHHISELSIYNNRYMKSYLKIVKQIVDEYNVTQVRQINHNFSYLLYKEYSVVFTECQIKFEDSLDLFDQNIIYRSIMDDDIITFIDFTEREEFDKNQVLHNDLYPYPNYYISLLELCCYYGAVDCFKFLRTKFQSEITPRCLQYSFLGGNLDIMNECLKEQKPDDACMKYAIISHNIDFVTFLRNEHKIGIDLRLCSFYNNLQAFLVYLDQTNDIETCLFFSPAFNIPSLVEYLISNLPNITPLEIAVRKKFLEIVKIFLSNDAYINAKNRNGITPHEIAINNLKELEEIIVSNGADINAKD